MVLANKLEYIVQVVQIFSVKLVLEVCGGAGAVWGFSEAIGLRHDGTLWFWRPCALAVGTLFWARWLCQIRDYVSENKIDLRTVSIARMKEEECASLAFQNNTTYNNST
ncbi:hypothetical protein HJC23_012908 [Cyclotella cryptica]|uniref:Uncharacterized protein n=1 Tax=Cyclotella cryptica TaxID=29204 RepID=A0ABD3Q3Y5_9STRA